MRRTPAALLVLTALLAGCGGGGTPTTTTIAATATPETAARAAAPAGARVVFVAETGTGLAVAAYARGATPTARVLRSAGGAWHALPQAAAVRLRPLGPDPGSTVRRGATQIAAEFSAPQNIQDAGLWLDGKALAAEPHGTPRHYTAFGPATVGRGRHTVVAFASAGPSARAVAWTFRAR